jgi:hypothetical protein
MPKQFTIPKGKHRAWPWVFGIYWNKRYMSRSVRFDESCRYRIGSNQADINKLFGIRYLFGDNSARFGWRYVIDGTINGKIELLAYVHDRGVVTKSEREKIICQVNLNQEYKLEIVVTRMQYIFSVTGPDQFEADRSAEKTHHNKLSFRQGLYFGGRLTAPDEIKISIRKHK